MIAFVDLRTAADITTLEAATYPIPRDCPRCGRAGNRGTVIGHGRRRRTCLDEVRSSILIRRGWCRSCRGTITFLPRFLRPRGSYALSVMAAANPMSLVLADLDRSPDAATVRRWRSADPRAPTLSA